MIDRMLVWVAAWLIHHAPRQLSMAVLRAAHCPESIALTLRHDFSLLESAQREAVLREATQIWEHHVGPLLRDLEDVGNRRVTLDR